MNKTIKHVMHNRVTSDIAEKDVDTHSVRVLLPKTIWICYYCKLLRYEEQKMFQFKRSEF